MIRYEWFKANDVKVKWISPKDHIPDGAIMISGSINVAIEGTPTELEALAHRIIDTIPKQH